MLHSVTTYSSHRLDTIEAHRVAVERAIQHMRTHFAETLDLDAIARVAATSKYHLVRVFDEITGTTPHNFLSCLRMQRAKELLLENVLSITEICLEVGYTSLGTFSKTFNELVGVSPQDFRKFPRQLSPMQFARAVWAFLSTDRKVEEPVLEGVVETPSHRKGFTFVGVFPNGVPVGVPFSGTVMMKAGQFRIQQPPVENFHLLAAFIPMSADLAAIITTLPVEWVASLRMQMNSYQTTDELLLRLRPLRLTDPPILLALPALPPWRDVLVK